MIEESALITRLDEAGVWIEVNRKSACAACSAQAGCGQKKLIDWLPSKRVEVLVENPLNLILTPGQTVTVGLEEGVLLRASVLVYLTPLAGLIFFTLFLNFLGFLFFTCLDFYSAHECVKASRQRSSASSSSACIN